MENESSEPQRLRLWDRSQQEPWNPSASSPRSGLAKTRPNHCWKRLYGTMKFGDTLQIASLREPKKDSSFATQFGACHRIFFDYLGLSPWTTGLPSACHPR